MEGNKRIFIVIKSLSFLNVVRHVFAAARRETRWCGGVVVQVGRKGEKVKERGRRTKKKKRASEPYVEEGGRNEEESGIEEKKGGTTIEQ